MSKFDNRDKEKVNIFDIKARNRERRYKDFANLADGSSIYTGRIYLCEAENADKIILIVKLLSVLSLLLGVLQGSLKVPGMINTWYIILCYVISLFFVGYTLYNIFKVKNIKEGLREYIYNEGIKRVEGLSVSCAVIEAVFILLDFIYIILLSSKENITVNLVNGFIEISSKEAGYFLGETGSFSVLTLSLFYILAFAIIFFNIVIRKKLKGLSFKLKE